MGNERGLGRGILDMNYENLGRLFFLSFVDLLFNFFFNKKLKKSIAKFYVVAFRICL